MISVDTNLFGLFRRMAEETGGTCESRPEYSFVRLEPAPWGNAVFLLDLTSPGAALSLADRVRQNEAPGLIMVGPTSRPGNAGALLAAGGFELKMTAHGMSMYAGDFKEPANPAGLVIKQIDSVPDLDAWSSIVVRYLFNAPDGKIPHFRDLISRVFRSPDFRCVLALDGGEPAASAFAYLGPDGIGGVYFVATSAEKRRRGFGAAATGAAVRFLLERKAGQVILQATDAGKPVYEALGFRKVCDLGRYRPRITTPGSPG